jgi:hypothetical protein
VVVVVQADTTETAAQVQIPHRPIILQQVLSIAAPAAEAAAKIAVEV